MRVIIISGGNIQRDFALGFLGKIEYEKIIVADKGMEFCHENNLDVDWIVGDFDSVSSEQLKYYEEKNIPITRLRPEKDDSDTQSALHIAMEMGADEVVILGATGTRIDHVYANIQLLASALAEGLQASLYDAYNYITVKNQSFQLSRQEQFGKYVSFFSLGDVVKDLTLEGFKYPLINHPLKNTDSGLSVSNEIVEEIATVTFSEGTLVMIQSHD